jgi:MFS family permease
VSVDNKVLSIFATANGSMYPTFSEAILHIRTIHLWLSIVLTASYGLFFAGNFKNYEDYDDSFLTLVGSMGAVANGGTRYFWGLLHDKKGFKFCYYIALGLNIVTALTIDLIKKNKVCFLIWYMVTLGALGGHFNCFPVVFSHLYGIKTGGKVYSFVFSAFGISTILGVLMY